MSIKIALDAGHGSNTAGKRSCPFTKDHEIGNGVIVKKGETWREHYSNVMVNVLLAQELERNGFEVVKIAWNDSNYANDQDISLYTRIAQVKAAKCDMLISSHFNACGDALTFNSGHGVATYIRTNVLQRRDSKKLANLVQNSIVMSSKQRDRGVCDAQFAMTNAAAMGVNAAILVEYAFMTNEYECYNYFANYNAWVTYAKAVCKAVCAYFNREYKDGDNNVVETTKSSDTTASSDTSKIQCLGKGDTGESVKTLQTNLNKILSMTLTVDGCFGVKTLAAVKTFQSKYKLTVDGCVGPNTQEKIDTVLKTLTNVNTETTTAKTTTAKTTTETVASNCKVSNVVGVISYGSKGNNVKTLQRALNKILGTALTIDGCFGIKTKTAVKTFQKKYGLTVDGCVGPKTKSKFKSLGY